MLFTIYSLDYYFNCLNSRELRESELLKAKIRLIRLIIEVHTSEDVEAYLKREY